MTHYETLNIISSKITEEELPFVIEKIIGLIKKNGGETTKEVNLGKKKLAYSIKQNRYGFYSLIEFNLPANQLSNLQRDFRLTEEIIKYQILKARLKSEKELEEEKIAKERREKEILKEKKVTPFIQTPLQEISLDKKKEEEKTAKPAKKKITLEELDEKLDKILEDDMIK